MGVAAADGVPACAHRHELAGLALGNTDACRVSRAVWAGVWGFVWTKRMFGRRREPARGSSSAQPACTSGQQALYVS
jgi:hypothetical protein